MSSSKQASLPQRAIDPPGHQSRSLTITTATPSHEAHSPAKSQTQASLTVCANTGTNATNQTHPSKRHNNSIPASDPSRAWAARCAVPATTRLPLDLDAWMPKREFDAKMRCGGYTRAMLVKTAVGRKIDAAAAAAAGKGGL